MDILIKNLRLPREYEQVNITILSDGSIIEHFRNESGKWSSYRSGGLKAIELQPHGDIIDAQAIEERAKEIQYEIGITYKEALLLAFDEASVVVEANNG